MGVIDVRFRNCILGLAVGDALGMPVEGVSRENVKKIYGEVRDFLPSPYGDLNAGEWTDDTEQMMLLVESILETVHFSPENFAERLKKWFLEERKSRRVGPSSRKAISNLLRGVHWSKAGVFSDTCGAAVRVAPIGLVYHFNLNMVEKYAELSARITHIGTAAIGGAIAVAIAVACNIRDFSGDKMLSEVVKRVKRVAKSLSDKIEYAYEIVNRNLNYAVERLGNSISSLDVVPMAFYSFFSGKDFEESVIKAVSAGGDADSIAAITGALKGSAGFKIPERWLERLKSREMLEELAKRLRQLYARISRQHNPTCI